MMHESLHRTKEAGELRNSKKRDSPQNRFTGSDVCPERVRNVAPPLPNKGKKQP